MRENKNWLKKSAVQEIGGKIARFDLENGEDFRIELSESRKKNRGFDESGFRCI